MARRAANRKLSPKQRQRRRAGALRRRRIPVRNTRSSNSQSLGPLVAKGVRSVLGTLPGSAITTAVADFIFSSVGWTSEKSEAQTGSACKLEQVCVTGLCAALEVESTMFAASIPSIGIIFPMLSGNPERADISTQWRAARISVLKVVARPSGPTGTVSGTWAIGYLPFTAADSRLKILADIKKYGVNFEMIRQLPCSMMADANKPLILRYYHTPRDGDAFQPKSFDVEDTSIGLFLVAYSDMMRSSFTELTQADFQTTIDFSATLILSQRNPGTPEQISNAIASPVKVGMYVRTANQYLAYHLDGFSCTNNRAGACAVSGVVDATTPAGVGSMLDRMVLD